jgi:hypothetical protein
VGFGQPIYHDPRLFDLLVSSVTFEAVADGFRDRETGTLWNLLGRAVRGPLEGRRLSAVPHVDAFWFAWAAFNPSTSIHGER